MHKYQVNKPWKVVFETPDDGYSYFFGYYDKPALNRDNTLLLCHRVAFDGRDVKDGDIAEIGYIRLENGHFTKIDQTLAWNWQQGCQLQWLPPSYDDQIIYNTIINNSFASVIYTISNCQKQVIPFPIYAIHPSGKEALAIQYERHYWCRPGYSYQNIKNEKWNKLMSEEDGIFKIDLESGLVVRIINLVDIINDKKLPEFDFNSHWLEHIIYSPKGDRFMFFHRWRVNDVDNSRVFTASSNDGEQLFMYPDNRFYSHYFWKNDHSLTIWTKISDFSNKGVVSLLKVAAKRNMFSNFLRLIYRKVKIFLPKKITASINQPSILLTFKDKTQSYELVGENILTGNGHQSWFRRSNKLLNDTYQDENNYRHLMVFDNENQEIDYVGKFYSHYNDSVFRCDLHPKLSIDEQYIVIDSAHTEKRKMMIIERANDNA